MIIEFIQADLFKSIQALVKLLFLENIKNNPQNVFLQKVFLITFILVYLKGRKCYRGKGKFM